MELIIKCPHEADPKLQSFAQVPDYRPLTIEQFYELMEGKTSTPA